MLTLRCIEHQIADQSVDVPTLRAKTDSLIDRGLTVRRLSRMHTRQLVCAATRNAQRFDKDSPCIRDALTRAAS